MSVVCLPGHKIKDTIKAGLQVLFNRRRIFSDSPFLPGFFKLSLAAPGLCLAPSLNFGQMGAVGFQDFPLEHIKGANVTEQVNAGFLGVVDGSVYVVNGLINAGVLPDKSLGTEFV
jgi:hypothetical protein